ncbi:hypothetical protein OOZ15_04120 [Galbibacter sp. EGI 63066]|uniref:hypothetical protein n=1 Tax=Galbibacter sp. EGI 63066 TaxID=2993559 RepID=UPI0022492633|nr:hypothetical protein [Galbibacter sp. EGI 63066]MCX2679118.1 hypothetical protein [Galbibacter sp. EGI 63066]
MAEITLKYDARNSLAKKTLDYILSLGVFEKQTPLDKLIDEAEKDIKAGNVERAENVEEWLENLS